MRLDCWETQAPIWPSRGRLWKYLTTSSVDKRSALPITITWRSSICHGNSRLTWGFFQSDGLCGCQGWYKTPALFIVMLQQHNTLVRLAALINGSNHHRGRVCEFRVTGLTQPAFKQRQGFSRKIVATQTASGYIHGASARFAGVRRYQTWPLRM